MKTNKVWIIGLLDMKFGSRETNITNTRIFDTISVVYKIPKITLKFKHVPKINKYVEKTLPLNQT